MTTFRKDRDSLKIKQRETLSNCNNMEIFMKKYDLIRCIIKEN